MKLLLDTQCLLWWFAQPERLNEEAIAYWVSLNRVSSLVSVNNLGKKGEKPGFCFRDMGMGDRF